MQTRDFVYVGDLAALLADALPSRASAGQAVNVGRGQQSSLLDLVDVLEMISGKTLERNHVAARVGDIRHSCADTRRLQQLFGIVPKTDLAAGLKLFLSTLEY